ncbi:MAG: hypothetical protein ACTHKU_06660, partial [Verrucomicrobiota bacterium]
MKIPSVRIVLAAMVAAQSFGQSLSPAAVPVNKSADFSVIERGANHRVWERTEYEITPDGEKRPHVHRYTELATGMHYKGKNGEWLESVEELELLPNGAGAAATKGQQKVIFPPDIYDGQVEIEDASGQWFRFRVLGLSYFDTATGKSVLIAETTNSIGELHEPNVVTYPNAFTDIKASVRYTYTRLGCEQDIILNEQPVATPEAYGLHSDSTVLQVLTEVFESPRPRIIQRAVGRPAEGKTTVDLDFGAMRIGAGQ